MALFTVWRELNAGPLRDESDLLAKRSIALQKLAPDVVWLGSYVIETPARPASLCAYDAPDESRLESALARSALPAGEIRAADLFLSEDYIPDELNKMPPGGGMYIISRQFPPETSAEEVEAAAFRSAHCLGFDRDISWTRSFWDDERKFSRCIYLATSTEAIQLHARRARIPCDAIDPALEICPQDWEHLYLSEQLPIPSEERLTAYRR